MELNFDSGTIQKNFIEMIDEFFELISNTEPIQEGKILVLGCSTSEVVGEKLGKSSTPEIAKILIDCLYAKCLENKIYLAVQCCEHLNRALVMEREAAERFNYEIVCAVPKSKAGGSAAEIAFQKFTKPVLVEFIKADYGIDIGDTFIGMHMKHVVIPIRLSKSKSSRIGKANITFASSRPKYIGGERTQYKV